MICLIDCVAVWQDHSLRPKAAHSKSASFLAMVPHVAGVRRLSVWLIPWSFHMWLIAVGSCTQQVPQSQIPWLDAISTDKSFPFLMASTPCPLPETHIWYLVHTAFISVVSSCCLDERVFFPFTQSPWESCLLESSTKATEQLWSPKLFSQGLALSLYPHPHYFWHDSMNGGACFLRMGILPVDHRHKTNKQMQREAPSLSCWGRWCVSFRLWSSQNWVSRTCASACQQREYFIRAFASPGDSICQWVFTLLLPLPALVLLGCGYGRKQQPFVVGLIPFLRLLIKRSCNPSSVAFVSSCVKGQLPQQLHAVCLEVSWGTFCQPCPWIGRIQYLSKARKLGYSVMDW